MTPNTTQKLRQSTHVQARPQNVQDRSPLTKHHCFIGQSAHFTAVPRLNVRNQRSHFRRWLNQTPILGQLEFLVFFLFFLGESLSSSFDSSVSVSVSLFVFISEMLLHTAHTGMSHCLSLIFTVFAIHMIALRSMSRVPLG